MEAVPITSDRVAPEQTTVDTFPLDTFDTTEIRWFAAGPMPRRLVGWFTSEGRHGTLEVRDDSYLVGAAPSVGRKRRNRGTFEIKTRLGVGSVVKLDGRLSGRTEDWRKVIGMPPRREAAAPRWTDVHKVILTRTYRIATEGETVEVSPGNIAIPGCDVELAAVSVGTIEAWTFALEAWGPQEQRCELLEKSAAAFVSSAGMPESVISALGADMSYPAWLNLMIWGGPGRGAGASTDHDPGAA